jgi:hypothetical protein
MLYGLFLLGGVYPLFRAWRANHDTTLGHALAWLSCAWLVWTVAAFAVSPFAPRKEVYLALCLTGCAGVAVLGARRPGVGAWNAVVAGLLLVLLRPLLEGMGDLRPNSVHLAFLGATLAIGLLNYLPTRFFLTALAGGLVCAVELGRLGGASFGFLDHWGWPLLAAAPWLGLASAWRRIPEREFDRIWLGFRDRFGFVWAQRLRDQFNRASSNAGWPTVLAWSGVRLTQGHSEVPPEALAALQALLKRFGPP